MFKALRTFLCAVAAVCFLLPASAQTSTANVFGTITDATGAAIGKATVTITQTDTNATRTVVSKRDGTYRADFLPIGPYTIQVSAPGFKMLDRTGIVLTVGQEADLSLALQVGGTGETVEVTSDVPLVNLGNSTIGRTVSNVEVDNLPLVNRDTYQLLNLTPGVQNGQRPLQLWRAGAEHARLPGASRLRQRLHRRPHRPGGLLSRRRPQHDRHP